MTGLTTRAAIFFLIFASFPVPSRAQAIRGVLVDDTNGRAIGGAAVYLVDRTGERVHQTLADGSGRFLLTPAEQGEYVIRAERIGYRVAETPLLRLTTSGSVALELTMLPAPVGLEGLEVDVDVVSEAEGELRLAGLEPRSLGRRWITKQDVEAMPLSTDLGGVLEWRQVPSVQILRSENRNPLGEDMDLCVSLLRARTGAGRGRCALNVRRTPRDRR